MIGRILAVADAFSAMTTTRPYRKALPLDRGPQAPRRRRRHAAPGGARHRNSSPASRPPPTRRCRARSRPSCGDRSCGWRDDSARASLPRGRRRRRHRRHPRAGRIDRGRSRSQLALEPLRLSADRNDRRTEGLHPDRDERGPARGNRQQSRDRLCIRRCAGELQRRRRGGDRLERGRRLARRLGDRKPRHRPYRQRWRAPGAPRLGAIHDHRHAPGKRLHCVECSRLSAAGLFRRRRVARCAAARGRHRCPRHPDAPTDAAADASANAEANS